MENILFEATGGDHWIGGLYHSVNILFSILQNESITSSHKVIVATEEKNVPLFRSFEEQVLIVPLKYKNSIERRVKLIAVCLKHHCRFVFHGFGNYYRLFGVTMIRWIPDFQHNHLPEFFTDKEIGTRNKIYQRVAASGEPLVLSSNDSLRDLNTFYPNEKKNVFVVPFVSYIEPVLLNIMEEKEQAVLEQYDLAGGKYACVMNQFWQHKNHIAVLEAMQIYFSRNPDSDFLFIFTGKMSDYRHPDYIDRLNRILALPEMESHVRLLGFIERDEQIVIMKHAEYVVQPSLFEGWGTVVEDAKVLDKTILLSDIPVHREQKNEKCILFDPHNYEELADLIEKENGREHKDSIEKGIKNMYVEAKEYSKGFAELLGCR